MLKVRRILRDYQEAGSLNSLIGLWGFVDDETFITKAGHVGIVYRLAGVDYECLDQAQRRDVVHRYEAALRGLDESCRVYQYLIKRRVAPIEAAPCRQRLAHEAVQRRAAYLNSRRGELYELDVHLVLVYEGLRSGGSAARRARTFWTEPRTAIRNWLSPSANLALVESDLDRVVAQLRHKAAAFEVQLADSVHVHRHGSDKPPRRQ
jgi:type IV secretory pathway VirB4 component